MHKQQTAVKCDKYEDSLEYTIQLVNNVRQHPCLYDGANASTRRVAWKEVAAKLGGGATAQSCMLKWKKIRYFYMCFLKKGYVAKPGGIESHLSFLNSFIHLEPVETGEFLSAKQLAGIVRKYPTLYDGSLTAHNIALWNRVAQLMGAQVSVESCVTKWVKLRSKYESHLKTGSKMVPYGIERHLSFLAPFVEGILRETPKPLSTYHFGEEEDPATFRGVAHLKVDESDADVQFLLRFVDVMTIMSEPQKRLFRIRAVKASRAALND